MSLGCLVSFSLSVKRSGHRSVPRIRTRRHGPPSPERSPVRILRDFQHAVTLSDIPGNSKPPAGGGKVPGAAKEADSFVKKALFCQHCQKQGHVADRCYQLHPELRRHRPDKKKSTH